MDTVTFLTRVTAPQDCVVICSWRPDRKGGNPRGIFWNRGSFDNLAEAAEAIAKWDAEPDTTIYYSVGTHAGHEYEVDGKIKFHRYQSTATWFKDICFDLDIGADKPYATQREGHQALVAALSKIGMPDPMVVSSGNGIHYHWPLTAPIKREHWEKISIALRMALQEQAVVIDYSKIHDPSMVLRPAGTHHKKQTPWKDVQVLRDCPDYSPVDLAMVLKPWFGKAAEVSRASKPKSAKAGFASAVLNDNNVNLRAVVGKCKQLRDRVLEGGASAIEPLWRLDLGFARFCTDPEQAIRLLAGKHAQFDLAGNMDKMASWKGTGPTTCAKYAQVNPAGCGGCSYSGKITSPAVLSHETQPPAPPPRFGIDTEQLKLPEGYFVDSGMIWTEEEKEVKKPDPENPNKKVTKTEIHKVRVCPYEMHVVQMFGDQDTKASTAQLLVKYPLSGWKLHEMPMGLVSGGKELQQYLLDRQIIIPEQAVVDRTRTFIMKYLEMVQRAVPSGVDYSSFGWQQDGSFLCGEKLIGAPSGTTSRRLKGAAATFGGLVVQKGSREVWAEATRCLDDVGGEVPAASLLTSCIGALGSAPGNSSFIFSIYSTETTTGKTLSLKLGNSTYGAPEPLLFPPHSTSNALYKAFGTLGNLSGSVDEVTQIGGDKAAELAYNISQGTEKMSMTATRDLREQETWQAPTRMSSNTSLYYLYDTYKSNNEPLRMRTLEFELTDRRFVDEHGYALHDAITQNYGFVIPELAEAIHKLGGPQEVWTKGVAAFEKAYPNKDFTSPERFYRTAVIGSYIVGLIGARLGLFRFDVDKVVRFMYSRVKQLRKAHAASRLDAFDVLGQYMQEHNDQMIVYRQEYDPNGKGRGSVGAKVPERACIRMELVYDQSSPVMSGSKIMVNVTRFKEWLRKSKDNLNRLLSELREAGALIHPSQRITMYKGCHMENPGQAMCFVVDATHLRIANAITSSGAAPQTAPGPAVLNS